MRIFIACIVLIFTKTVFSEADLQQQNENEYLNPVNDYQSHPEKEQDKRTIFSNNYGWAKHVGVHPSGFKYIIGYGPVDLKYVPVVRPITFKAPYHHHLHRPKLHIKRPLLLRPLLPVRPVLHQDGWKPIVPIVKPVVKPVLVPPNKPWHQDGWVSAKPVHIKPVVPVQPVVPVKPVQPVVPLKPVHPEIKPVHHVPVRPVVPVAPARPLVPVQPVAPLVPVAPVFKPLPPIIGQFPILQVPTAPGGVPLFKPGIVGQYAPGHFLEVHGTHNLVPIAHPVHVHPVHPAHDPHVHVPSQIPVDPHLHVHPVNPHVHVQPQIPVDPHLHIHPINPHVHVQPQIPVNPHLHVHPVNPHVHVQPQVPVDPVNPHVHFQSVNPHFHVHGANPHVHLIPQVPVGPHVHAQPPHEQHDVQTPLVPQDHPIFHQVQDPNIFQQQLPQDPRQVFHQQEAPIDQPLPQNPPIQFNQQLPGNVQHLYNQQIQHGEGATSSILLQGSTIQPGHTDLQIPLHLPQHPNYLPEGGRQFQPGNFHDPSQHPENIVRPSFGLEPPYTNK